MFIWILRRYLEGPPPLIGYTATGMPLAEGPSGESIEFAQESKPLALGTTPPVGVVVIRSIH